RGGTYPRTADPLAPSIAERTSSVTSISCVLRPVSKLSSCIAPILGTGGDRDAYDPRARRVPRRGRSLHRRDRRGVLPPLRGPQGVARDRADLRGARRADEARDCKAARGSADRALALRLRRLPRQPDAVAPGAARESRVRARSGRRRRTYPLPNAAPSDCERARPRPAAAARGDPAPADRRGAGTPVPPTPPPRPPRAAP